MYKLYPIFENTTQIVDEMGDCAYLIKGKEKAVLIDTGMSKQPIVEVTRTLSELPVEVLLTHGHIDHIAQNGDFEKVWMHPADLEVYASFLIPDPDDHSPFALQKEFSMKTPDQILPLQDGVIEDPDLIAVECFGHTPGSLLFVDKKNKAVYSGDAIGSGCGVWLWDDVSYGLKEYENSLKKCVRELKQLGVDSTWKFFGGHFNQEYMSRVSECNTLNLQLMEDMIELCEILQNGEPYKEAVDPSGLPHPKEGLKPFYTMHKKAEMLCSEDKLKPFKGERSL